MTALLDRIPNNQPAIPGAAATRHPGDPDRPLTAKKRIAKDRIAKDHKPQNGCGATSARPSRTSG